MSKEAETKPNITDYLASATLSYAIVYFWIIVGNKVRIPCILNYLVYFLAGAVPTYLVLRKIERNQFPVAIIASLVNWGFTFVCLITFMQGNSMVFFRVLLVFYLLGGVTSSVITMKARLAPREPKA